MAETDKLYGDDGSRAAMQDGADLLIGGDGDDIIFAGAGNDSVYGGLGRRRDPRWEGR